MLELYKNIKKLRMELGMSQDALAKMTGYTDRSSIAKIEKGDVDLQQSKIILFAKALNTTPKALMGWDTPEPTTVAAHFDTDDLTDAEREDVANYIEFVKAKRAK